MKKKNRIFLESGLGFSGKIYDKESVKSVVEYDPIKIAEKIKEHILLGANSLHEHLSDISAKYSLCIFSDKKNTFANTDEDGIPFYIYTTNAEVINNVVSLRLVGLKSNNGGEINFLPNMNEPIICDYRSLNEAFEGMNINFGQFKETLLSGDLYDITINSVENKLVRKRK